MTTSKIRQVLTVARHAIDDPAQWCQGCEAVTKGGLEVDFDDPDAFAFCALGATGVAARHLGLDYVEAATALRDVVPGGGPVSTFNDNPETTHADIRELFDRAIAAQE